MKQSICLYLHIHQPYRYRRYTIFDTGSDHNYWEDADYDSKQNNERIFKKVSEKSYRPMFSLLEKLLKNSPKFAFSLSITGTWLEQAEMWAPDLIEKLKDFISTGRVEIVGETYYHSLSFFYDREEFEYQVSAHRKKIKKLFGVVPKVFRNTELAYNDSLAHWAEEEGYKGILAEGWGKILGWRSPNHIYRPKNCKNLRLLLKNYRLSDDIAFRFSDKSWPKYPLTPEKYLSWFSCNENYGGLTNLFMDFETFGEHQWYETGIFNFFEKFVKKWISSPERDFLTASRACEFEEPLAEISMPETVTWADTERDLSAWTGNDMQSEALRSLYSMRDDILATKNLDLIADFRRLTTSDHAYYMCTKYWNDGDVHAYFSAYDSPYDAFMYFMNILHDLEYRQKFTQK